VHFVKDVFNQHERNNLGFMNIYRTAIKKSQKSRRVTPWEKEGDLTPTHDRKRFVNCIYCYIDARVHPHAFLNAFLNAFNAKFVSFR